MKKTLLFLPVLILLLIAACQKENAPTEEPAAKTGVAGDRSANTVTICHHTGSGAYNPLNVAPEAVPAHLAHGDYLPDADGDGYTAIGACSGSQDDCDDNNANVHPGATEACDNGLDDDCDGLTDCDDPDCSGGCTTCSCFDLEFLNSKAPFHRFFDSDVTDCSYYKGVAIFYDPGKVAGAFYTEDGVKSVSLYTGGSGFACEKIVGIDITEAEWENCRDLLRAAIAAHPGAPDFCLVGGKLAPAEPGAEAVTNPADEGWPPILMELLNRKK